MLESTPKRWHPPKKKINKVLKNGRAGVTTTPIIGGQQPTQGNHQDQYKLRAGYNNPQVTIHRISVPNPQKMATEVLLKQWCLARIIDNAIESTKN